jgi:protein TonB
VAGRDVPEPKRTKFVAPVYPAAARKDGVSGSVGVRITIGADGRVVDAVVTRSIPQLDQAALDAVRQWRYAPTIHKDAAVAVVAAVNVEIGPK